MKPVDLNEVLGNMSKMLRRVLGERISLEFRNEARRMWIEADSGMIEQVVMNLCVNSRDAMMPAGGPLTIETRFVEFGADAARANPNARAGKFVCLSVTDTGCGMDAAVMERIFEPFFTTKETGKGTGGWPPSMRSRDNILDGLKSPATWARAARSACTFRN